MTTATQTLPEFLLARIAEDGAVAQAAREHEYLSPARDASLLCWAKDHLGYGSIFVNSGRILAECEAKRRIVEEYAERDADVDLMLGPDRTRQRQWSGLRMAVHFLAAIYSDHPDYRDEWKP